MLIRLLPDQIAKYWDYVRFSLKEAAPSGYFSENDMLSNVLESLLIGTMQCWFVVKDGQEFELLACAVTRVYQEPTTGEKIFTLFSLYGYDNVDLQAWSEALESVVKFAIMSGCVIFDAYVTEPTVLQLAEKAGFKTRHYVYLELPR